MPKQVTELDLKKDRKVDAESESLEPFWILLNKN